jgi:hypothetical protein
MKKKPRPTCWVPFERLWKKHSRTKVHLATVKFLKELKEFEARSRRSRLTVKLAR